MKYYQIAPRLTKIIGLEVFVFLSFLFVCEVINLIIVDIPSSPNLFWNFILATLKVGLSLFFTGLWLLLWYFLTKRLMKTEEKLE
ncbi:MAG: hypothetical protein ACTSQE_00165 [Candidatus Heimdallarchaeaceae archaeon]